MKILEAAGNNPLLAQQMEDELSGEWWERWETYRDGMIAKQKLEQADEDHG